MILLLSFCPKIEHKIKNLFPSIFYFAAILAMVGVGAYPNLEAALKILAQDSNVQKPQANPLYEAGFKRYKLLYDTLKAVR